MNELLELERDLLRSTVTALVLDHRDRAIVFDAMANAVEDGPGDELLGFIWKLYGMLND